MLVVLTGMVVRSWLLLNKGGVSVEITACGACRLRQFALPPAAIIACVAFACFAYLALRFYMSFSGSALAGGAASSGLPK